MAITPILVDRRPAFLRSSARATSLLLTPLGGATLLEYIQDRIREAESVEALTISPQFAEDEDYRNSIRTVAPNACVRSESELDDLLHSLEPSDWLLVVDVSHFPVSGLDFSQILDGLRNCHLARHLVPLQADLGGTREYVVYDANRRVSRIQRYYEGVTQLQTAGVTATFATVAAVQSAALTGPLTPEQLRSALSSHGTPMRDIPMECGMFDLAEEADFLRMSNRFTEEAADRAGRDGRGSIAPVVMGDGVRIDPTARLYGPVVLHDRAVIGRGAVLIGPTLVGADAQVGNETIVAHSLILPEACVPDQAVIQRRVFSNAKAGSDSTPPSTHATSAYFGGNGRLRVGVGRDGPRVNVGRTDRSFLRLKRLIDVVIASAGLIVLMPLMLATALLIKLTSRGPVLFAHEREGKSGRVFRCWKFRTMVHDAHAQQRTLYEKNAVDGPQFKLDQDPRITWLGHRLRTSNIDELPQLFNVIMGEMSLIGPRPSPFRENQICVPWRNARLSVQPGITGLWQICRHERSAGDFHQWIYYDTLYVRHMSGWLDTKIILGTLLTLGGRFSVPLNWMISTGRRAVASSMTVAPVGTSPLFHCDPTMSDGQGSDTLIGANQ